MSTETTNKKIKIDNGTTFGKTYTDKAIDAKLPTDLIASAKKLSLGVGATALGNGVNLDGFTYDEATKTLKASGGEVLPKLIVTVNETEDGSSASIDLANSTVGNYILDTNYSGLNVPNSGFGAIASINNEKIFAGFINLGDFIVLSSYGSDNCSVGSALTCTSKGNNSLLMFDDNFNVIFLRNPADEGDYYLGFNNSGKVDNVPNWKEVNSKSISLFGKHSILVPKDSTDANIDLYLHSITVGKLNDTYLNGFTFLFPSSSNLVVDSIQDLNTLLGTTPRMIPVSGCYNPGTPTIITRLNWKGSFTKSTLITTGGEEDDILATFTSVGDDVTTL